MCEEGGVQGHPPDRMPTYRGTCASYTLPALRSIAMDRRPDKPGKIMYHRRAWSISMRPHA